MQPETPVQLFKTSSLRPQCNERSLKDAYQETVDIQNAVQVGLLESFSDSFYACVPVRPILSFDIERYGAKKVCVFSNILFLSQTDSESLILLSLSFSSSISTDHDNSSSQK